MAELWKKIKDLLAGMVDTMDYKVFVAPLEGRIDGHALDLTIPGASYFMISRLQSNMATPVRNAAALVLGCESSDISTHFHTSPAGASSDGGSETQPSSVAAGTASNAPTSREDVEETLLRPSTPSLLTELPERKRPSLVTESACAAPLATSVPILESEGRSMPSSPRVVQGQLLGAASLAQPLTASGAALQRKLWRHSFEEFVEGPTNEMAAAAAKDLCRPAGFVETLFLNSAAGLGKTHIAQAVGQEISQSRGTGARVAYLTAEEFFSRYRSGIRQKNLDDFTDRVKALDFLMLEDIQFLHGKEKTQELLMGLVKHLMHKGSRVVFTSQFSPKELKKLDSQLLSLICSGVQAKMGSPDYEMRREILRRKAKVHQVILPDEVTNLLASRLTGDIRQIESCLQTLLLKMRILKAPLTPQMALEVLDQIAPEDITPGAAPDIEDIIRYVADAFGLTLEQMRSRVRKKDYVAARNAAFYLARKHTDLTLQQIGDKLNKRHSTVIKGIANIESELAGATAAGRKMGRLIGMVERNAGVAATVGA